MATTGITSLFCALAPSFLSLPAHRVGLHFSLTEKPWWQQEGTQEILLVCALMLSVLREHLGAGIEAGLDWHFFLYHLCLFLRFVSTPEIAGGKESATCSPPEE